MKHVLAIAVVVLGAAVLIQSQDAETPKPVTPAPRKLDRVKGRQLYDLRYADRRKKVDASSDKDDDVKLAAEHLQDVGKFGGYPSLALVLCEQAYELGMRHRDGYATAAQAAEMLLSDFPELNDEHRPKVVRAYEAKYRANVERETAGERLIELYVDAAKALAAKDDFNAAFQMLIKAYPIASALKSPRKGEVLSKRRYYQTRRDLAKKPSDVKLRMETIRICVVELDNPAEAEKLLDGSLDEITKTYVPVAAQDPGEVVKGACLELGNWYLERSENASARGKLICLTRAKAYLDRFLALHEAKDESRLKAELLLDKVQKQLDALREAASAQVAKAKPAQPSGDGPAEQQRVAAFWGALRQGVLEQAFQNTPAVGGKGGGPFKDIPKDGALLVGFRMTAIRQRHVIKSLQPIYLSKKGRVLGGIYGRPEGKVATFQAKAGYAVAGLRARGGGGVSALKVVFMKVGYGGLDPNTVYTSDWYGSGTGKERRLGGDGSYVVGVTGRKGANLDVVGLVILPGGYVDAKVK